MPEHVAQVLERRRRQIVEAHAIARPRRLPQRRLGALEVAELAVQEAEVRAHRAGVAQVARLLERRERRFEPAQAAPRDRPPPTRADRAHLVHQPQRLRLEPARSRSPARAMRRISASAAAVRPPKTR